MTTSSLSNKYTYTRFIEKLILEYHLTGDANTLEEARYASELMFINLLYHNG